MVLSTLASLSLNTANCSGHGVQVDVQSNLTLCKCDFLYSGGGDFFDTRINSSSLSLTCENSQVGQIVIWAFVLVSSLYREFQLIQTFSERFRHFKENRGYSLKMLIKMDKGSKYILADMFTISLFLLLTSTLKVAGFVMGTDFAVTISFMLLVLTHQIIQNFLGQLEFLLVGLGE